MFLHVIRTYFWNVLWENCCKLYIVLMLPSPPILIEDWVDQSLQILLLFTF